MKKFTVLLFAVLTMAATASADDLLNFKWAHVIDGNTAAGDNMLGLAKASDGDYYVANTFGTTSTSLNVNFDGSALTGVDGQPIAGSSYTGTSVNNNLLLQKVDANGDVVWNAYTKKGDISVNSSAVAATPDGGVIAVVKTRAWVKEEGYDNLLEVVDGTGATTTIKDMNTQASEYRFLIVKLDNQGKLAWTRLVSGLVKTIDTKQTKDNAYLNGCAVDADGNLYLAGNFRTELTFKKADGSNGTLVAKNAETWNGDSQKNVGDLFLVKLDKDGYFEKSLLLDGAVQLAYIDRLSVNGGKIYFNGRVLNSADDNALSLGGKSLKASAAFQTLFVGAANTADLSVDYVTALTSVANSSNKFVLQNKNLQYADGAVYMTGLLNGGLQAANNVATATNSTMLKGYVVKVDAATGNVAAMGVHDTEAKGINGYFGVYVGSKVYAYAYDMGSGSKVVMSTFDKNSLAKEGDDAEVASYGSSLVAPVVDGNTVVLASRGKGNATFTGTDKTFTGISTWAVAYYSYTVNETATAINTATANATVANYGVYTTAGVQVKQAKSLQHATANLQKGIYIVGNKKVATK